MEEKEKIKTSIYLPEDLLWKLKELAAKRRLKSDTAAMEQAIRDWVDGTLQSGSHDPLPRADKFQRMLALIRASKDKPVIEAIEQNITQFFRLIGGDEHAIDRLIEADKKLKKQKSA